MSSIVKWRWGLVVFFVLAYLVPLGLRPMVVPDEFRYAEIPREMALTGEWNNPQLLHVPYYEKPAFGYQLTALSFRVFGFNRFALRLPAALAVGVAAWMIFLVMRRRSDGGERDEFAAVAAVYAYLFCGLVYGIGTFAVLDSQLTGAITVAVAAFFLATRAETRRTAAGWLLLCGAAAGFALLIKGLLGVAIPGMVIAGWLLWRRDWRRILCDPWLPLAALLLVVGPWAWAQHRAQPDFWEYFIRVEHLDRFTKGTSDSDPQPFWYFLPVFLGGIFPAALWLPAALAGWRGRWRTAFWRDDFWRLVVLWWGLPFLFFSISSAKLGTYILPCCVPFALWLGMGIAGKITASSFQDWTLRIFGIILFFGAIGFGLYQAAADFGAWPGVYARDEKWWLWLVAVGVVWGWWLRRNFRAPLRRQLAGFVCGGGALLLLGPGAIPVQLIGGKMPEGALAAFRAAGWAPADVAVIVDRSTMHAVPWCWERSDVYVWGSTGEISGVPAERRFAAKGKGIPEMRERLAPGRSVIVSRGEAGENPFPAELEPLEIGYQSGIWVAKF